MRVIALRWLVTGILSLFWTVLAYFGLLWLARRFFAGRHRAETVAAGVVVAFILGLGVSHARESTAISSLAVVTQAVRPSSSVANSPAGGGALNCARAQLTALPGKGNFDGATVKARSGATPALPNVQLRSSDILLVSGWAAAPDLNSPASNICLAIDGKIISDKSIVNRGNRPDVVQAYHDNTLSNAGFQIALPGQRIGSGLHLVQAAALAADGSAAILPGGIEVAGPKLAGN